MSTPSTPRTARSASAAADSPEILTPGRKIKALLAAFDSDSESDNGKSTVRKSNTNFLDSLKTDTVVIRDEPMALDSNLEEDEEDDDIVMPRGRMAARLQGHTTDNNQDTTQHTSTTESAFERVSKILRAGNQGANETRHDMDIDEKESSDNDDDDLPAAGPRRRIHHADTDRDSAEDGDSVRSRSRARSFSPLFVSSPTKQAEEEGSGSEEAGPKRNSRFIALVAKKRKEREEKERIEEEKKAAKAKGREGLGANLFSEEEDAEDGATGKKKSPQQARPGRKASKKALEEMHRETQRMSRNMQLAHEARTKKKISKESFFARFNFMQRQAQAAPEQSAENSSTTADSQHSSDVEAQKDKDTPHTSPALPPTDGPDLSKDGEMNFPTIEEILSDPTVEVVKAIGNKAQDETIQPATAMSEVKKGKLPVRIAPVRVRLSREQVARHQKDDSDDDLEIVTSPAKCRRIAAFENLPARQVQESASMFRLKVLAQLTSPTRKSTINSAELSASLLYEAKQQAAKERQERIDELRARGVVIETAAERAAFEDEVENLVEKARQEGEDIAKKEREAAKRKNGDDLDDDDDDSDFELSGSEDGDNVADDDGEEEDEEEELDAEAKAEREGDLIDSEADEDEDDDAEPDANSEMEEAAEPAEEPNVPTQRRKRRTRVVSDDEDEDEVQAPKTPAKPINPFFNSVERPNIPVKPSEATMSLTQAFAGTLAPSQDKSQQEATIPQSLPELVPMSVRQEPDSQIIIKDSQENRAGSVDTFGGYWQQDRVSESPVPRSMSQMSQIPDPTQDAGFVLSPFDPNKRFLGTPTSTVETVLVEQSHSPVAARNLRNLRRGKAPGLSAIEEQEVSEAENDESAFDMMKNAAKKTKKPVVDFDRKKSKAKDVVEEAAEESDDEYAGLGGASDDDADDDEENAYDREMINDNSGERVDAKQLAALNALHQRNADEKDVAKLLKDITTGALRRRRGNDDEFDLDDSDDEILARRRQKQREFARMRNALLADGKIGEIAENPKKAAFFKAIEDRDDEDDVGFDFLGYKQEGSTQDDPSSQDATTEAQSNNPQDKSNKRKRPLEPAAEDVNNRPPPHLRRKPASAMSKKPATLAEIRETVSFLTERPEYDSFQDDASVDEEEDEQHAGDGDDGDEAEEAEEQLMPARQQEPSVARSNPRRTRGPVVDRLALLRQASSNSATSASSNTRFAFHTGAGNDKVGSFGFRPPILRKTTTASSSSSSTSASDSSRVTKAGGASLAKKGAVNYYTAAREREREKQLRTQHRNRGSNITALLNKHAGNRLGALGGTGNWD